MADDQPVVQPVSEPRLAPNQNFEKRWTLHKTGDRIDKLDVTMPGLVYVSHDPTRTTSVRVSSESAELLDHVTVTQNNGDSSTTIQVRGTGRMVGHLLTEVSLQHEQAVHSLSTSGSATVVVEDGTLLTNKKLKNHQQTLSVKAAGSGDVFATSTRPFEVHSMRIASRGSGRLQVVAPAVLTKSSATIKSRGSGDVNVFVNDVTSADVLLSVAGSGDINLTAAATINLSGELQSSVAGSGKPSIFSNVLDAFSIKSEVAGSGSIATVAWSKLLASTMTTEVAGSGNVIIACGGVGSTSHHEVSIAGSGNVDASDVLADSSDVNVVGSGDVALRVAREAHESLLGSGTVRYAGLLPARVLSTGVRASFGSQSRQSSAQPLAASLAAAQRAPQAPPARAAAFSQLRAAQLVDWSGNGDGGAVGRFLRHLFQA